MGLDMYMYELTPKTSEKPELTLGEGNRFEGMNCEYDFNQDFGYWRKQNALHRRFIEEAGSDFDINCEPIYIPYEAILRIKEKIRYVILNPHKITEVFPGARGAFFGRDLENGKVPTEFYDTLHLLEEAKPENIYLYDCWW